MKLTAWVPATALALLLAACGSTVAAPGAGPTTATHAGDGRVVGTFMRVGGPIGPDGQQPLSIPLSGTVSFSAAHRRTVAVRVGKSGRFSVWLPAGAYDVVGRSPSIIEVLASGAERESTCAPRVAATVAAGRVVHLSVVCAVP